METKKREIGFYVLIGVGVLISLILIFGQSLAVFNYDLTVKLQLQESAEEIKHVGVAFSKGFGFSDMLIYLPLLISGIIGLLKNKRWAIYTMFGACAITAYWPLVWLYAYHVDRVSITLAAEKLIFITILHPLLTIYGVWGMWYLYEMACLHNRVQE